MTARAIYNIGSHRVTEITGDEVFSCKVGSQRDKEITASDLRHYMGGDVAVANLRLEAGAHARRISDLPNAEFEIGEGDILTGLQKGQNVNFSAAQILEPLLQVLRDVISRQLLGYTVDTLPAGEAGTEVYVIDGAAGLAIGADIRGGGSNYYKVWYNGRSWTVTGR